jgi:hypothetical protein
VGTPSLKKARRMSLKAMKMIRKMILKRVLIMARKTNSKPKQIILHSPEELSKLKVTGRLKMKMVMKNKKLSVVPRNCQSYKRESEQQRRVVTV